MWLLSASELLKAKYLKRWRGPKGNWRYAYPRDSSGRIPANPEVTGAGRGTLRGLTEKDVKKLLQRYSRRPKGGGKEKTINTKQELDVLLTKSTFALMSAGRNPNNPEDMKLTNDQVKARHRAMLDDLRSEGYVFTQCRGKYENPEESVMVMTHDADRDNVLGLGAKYNQDSVVFCSKGSNEMVYTTGPKKGTETMRGSGYEEVPGAKNYYTDMPLGVGGKVRFTMSLADVEKALRSMGVIMGKSILFRPTELLKAKRASVGATSRDGKRRKVAEGKWVDIPKGRDTRSAGEKMKAAVRTGPKVNTFERKLLSSAVQEAVSESYYTDIPLREIDDSMRKRGFLLLQEDNTPWAGMLLGSEGSALITIGRMAGTTTHDWGTTHQPIENSALALSWYRDEKRGDRRYDVVAYAT